MRKKRTFSPSLLTAALGPLGGNDEAKFQRALAKTALVFSPPAATADNIGQTGLVRRKWLSVSPHSPSLVSPLFFADALTKWPTGTTDKNDAIAIDLCCRRKCIRNGVFFCLSGHFWGVLEHHLRGPRRVSFSANDPDDAFQTDSSNGRTVNKGIRETMHAIHQYSAKPRAHFPFQESAIDAERMSVVGVGFIKWK